MSKQEELFKSWKYECLRLDHLGSYIQNDFDRGKADGHFSPELLEIMAITFKADAESSIARITKLAEDIRNLLEEARKQ